MIKPYLLRLHRWLTLAFALPLAVLVVTGLILSFEPIVATTAAPPAALTAERIDQLLAQHDPEGKARMLAVRPYDGTMSIMGVRQGAPLTVDVTTGAEAKPAGLAGWFNASRGLHEHLILDLDWLVSLSTAAMIALMLLGALMGWPRLANTISGWHKGTAWFLLPLVVLSPVTGLMLAYGVTFAGGPPMGGPGAHGPGGAPQVQAQGAGPRGQRGGDGLPVREAVKLLAAQADVSRLLMMRGRGPQMMARLNEGGEYRAYTVSREGVRAAPRNWPRLIHEGNWAGVWSGLVNVVTSLALTLLMGTGLVIWARRRFRKPQRQRVREARAA
ncbi:MAG: PepSY domain-containing protein [Rhizobiales bacterium]|nr:PepSY domain-containing protein [Hyphomicrobiales bacterium]